MKLYKHQERLLSEFPKRSLITWGTGTGKTIMGISLCNKALRNDQKVLVIVPKALKEKWQRDMHTFSTTLYTIMTKEEFKKNCKILDKHDAVLCDEFHFFLGIKSQLSKLLYWYLNHHNVEYRYFATATPYLSTPLNIFVAARLLGHEWNYRTFTNKFFYEVPMGLRRVLKIKPNIEEQIAQLVKEIGDVVDMEEIVEVPEQKFDTVFLELTKEQKEAIASIYEPQFIVEWTQKHQVENSFLYDKGEETRVYWGEKLDYIISFSKKHKKFAVICRYTKQLDLLKDILEKEGLCVYLISGQVDNRDEVVRQIEETESCVALIQADCAVGFELPSVPEMIFASLSFSFVAHEQAKGRILRINKTKENRYIYLVIKGGVDEDIYNSIMAKKDFSFAIYNKQVL